jgi:hypothetical protein
MFKLFLLLGVVLASGTGTAFTLNSYDVYKNNSIQRNNDLANIRQMNLDNETIGLANETFNEMDTVEDAKINFDEILYLAKQHNWQNISRGATHAKESCSNDGSLVGECNRAINEFKNYVSISNLNTTNRQSILSLTIDLENQIISHLNLQKEKESRIKDHLTVLDQKIASFEKITNVNRSLVPVLVGKKIIQRPVKTTSPSLVLASLPLAFGCLFSFISLFIFLRKRKIRKFYSRIFSISKKNKSSIRIYGEIKFNYLAKISMIERSFFDLLNFSKELSGFKKLKFKSDKLFLIIELSFLSPASFFNILNGDDQKQFAITINDIKDKIEEIGGELLLQTTYNHIGEIDDSKMLIYIPK